MASSELTAVATQLQLAEAESGFSEALLSALNVNGRIRHLTGLWLDDAFAAIRQSGYFPAPSGVSGFAYISDLLQPIAFAPFRRF